MSSQKIYKNFLFNQERDEDILDWLASLANQSKTVRQALRAFMAQERVIVPEVSLEDVMGEVKRLSEQIANIKVISRGPELQDEPQDVVSKLKVFGL